MQHKFGSVTPLDFIIDRVNIGILAVDEKMEIVLWNHFMEIHSRKAASEVLGQNLFDTFPDLPRTWLEKKIRSVFLLKNFSFTSWEQRPFLFQFHHTRPVTGGIDWMRQDCTFVPVRNEAGDVSHVCITLLDVTDTSIYQSKLKNALARLDDSNNRDGLTGIYNRRYLEKSISQEFSRIKRHENTFSLLMLDLDNFKRINDERGHLAGDEVIRRVAETLTLCVREYDVAGRYGGEEFAVVLPQTGMKGAITVGERLRKAVENLTVAFDGHTIPVTVSIGIAEAQQNTPNYEQIIHQADIALYQSKRAGRNRVTAYTDEGAPG
jgi:diguanylate cyclase (GGDEF)-like protein